MILLISNTYYGEHTTTIDGNGKDPGRKELLAVGITAGMKKNRFMEIIDEIEKCVEEMLGVCHEGLETLQIFVKS